MGRVTLLSVAVTLVTVAHGWTEDKSTSYVIAAGWDYNMLRFHNNVDCMRRQTRYKSECEAYRLDPKDFKVTQVIASKIVPGGTNEPYYRVTDVKVRNRIVFKGVAFTPEKWEGDITLTNHLDRVLANKGGVLGTLSSYYAQRSIASAAGDPNGDICDSSADSDASHGFMTLFDKGAFIKIDAVSAQKGKGKALMRCAKQKSKEKGYKTLKLNSLKAAEDFWQKMGFKKTGNVDSEGLAEMELSGSRLMRQDL